VVESGGVLGELECVLCEKEGGCGGWCVCWGCGVWGVCVVVVGVCWGEMCGGGESVVGGGGGWGVGLG